MSIEAIQNWLKTSETSVNDLTAKRFGLTNKLIYVLQQRRTVFANKAPMRPIVALSPMERNQIDLVDMREFPPCSSDGNEYRYVLSVIDVFSRYVILRPLHRKTAAEVSKQLIRIYCDIGAPRLIQCNQGTEFKGAVKELMKVLDVQIITSRPYHPQSQGKVRICNDVFCYENIFLFLRLNAAIVLGKTNCFMTFA